MFWETHSTSSASFFLLLHLTISQNPSVLLLGSVCCSFSLWPLWGIDGDKGALLILSWTQWTLSRLTTLVSLYNTARKFCRMPRLIQCSSNSIHWCRLPHKHDLPTLTFFNFTLFPRQHFSYNRCEPCWGFQGQEKCITSTDIYWDSSLCLTQCLVLRCWV